MAESFTSAPVRSVPCGAGSTTFQSANHFFPKPSLARHLCHVDSVGGTTIGFSVPVSGDGGATDCGEALAIGDGDDGWPADTPGETGFELFEFMVLIR